ncbi:type II toxin-antitoxin system VapC family toxin [Luteithermobacter gelatinilyticus]|uniref:type II toxin-antitoxin system VapC family toxin n=1 Tax=Luteithermobacter gelatinilyticus TaxID=2582913 RepID=UPI00110628C4|nr:type II toxin-antitoxin system VapC family toxin [Luteithermobacter gelatinilyticus]
MFLLDTNVISELRKAHTDRMNENVRAWAATVEAGDLFISVITIQEIHMGILQKERKDPKQGRILRAWFESQVIHEFQDRVYPVDINVALKAGEIHVPAPKPIMDAFIAATALVHNLTLVTRNHKDFSVPGVKIINPWNEG